VIGFTVAAGAVVLAGSVAVVSFHMNASDLRAVDLPCGRP
jgi:hypothetical protein